MTATPIGFIGLGAMGEHMCANLVRKSGSSVFGTDLDPGPLARLAAEGLIACGSAEDVAQRAEMVFLSLPGGPQVEAIVDALLRAPGRLTTIVDMSTSPVDTTRRLAARCAETGIGYADAPVARSREAARQGTLMIMVGAGEALFAQIAPMLRCMGSDVIRCGDPRD